jgi:hypothetical protein
MRPITLIFVVVILIAIGWYFNIGNIQGRATSIINDNQDNVNSNTYVPACTASTCSVYEYCDNGVECRLIRGRCYTGEDCKSGQCTDFHYCVCTTNADCEQSEGFNCNTAKGYCSQSSASPQ